MLTIINARDFDLQLQSLTAPGLQFIQSDSQRQTTNTSPVPLCFPRSLHPLSPTLIEYIPASSRSFSHRTPRLQLSCQTWISASSSAPSFWQLSSMYAPPPLSFIYPLRFTPHQQGAVYGTCIIQWYNYYTSGYKDPWYTRYVPSPSASSGQRHSQHSPLSGSSLRGSSFWTLSTPQPRRTCYGNLWYRTSESPRSLFTSLGESVPPSSS